MAETSEYGINFEHDTNFKGPLQKRSCTDIFCLIIFVVFIITWSFVGYYAINRGDIETILNPTSSSGRKCGIDSEVKNKPFLMYFDLDNCLSLTSCSVQSICQGQCPSENFNYNYSKIREPLETVKKKMKCKFDIDLSVVTSWNQLDKLVANKKCAQWYLNSRPIWNRCIPLIAWEETIPMNEQQLTKVQDIIKYLVELQRTVKYVIEDLEKTWGGIISFIAASGVVAVLHIILLKCLALPFVYISIFGICVVLSYGIHEAYVAYTLTKSTNSLVSLITMIIVLSVILLCTLFLRKRIYLACQLIKESSIAVTNILSSLIFPIFPWIAQLLLIIFSVTVALLLTSIGVPIYEIEVLVPEKCICPEPIIDKAVCDPIQFNAQCKENGSFCVSAGCHLSHLQSPQFINYMHGVNVFGLFWIFFFILGLGEMILAAAFATWYWTFKKKDVPFFTMTISIWRTFRYHMGTIAFGSLLIAICSLIRLLLNYISKKLKNYGNNQMAQGVVNCCRCYFWMFERFLKYINKNAYIMCAIHGKNFYNSAQDAFNLLIRNIIRVVVLDKITEWLLLLGKLYITCLAGFVAWLYYEKYHAEPVNFWIVPVVMVTVGSYSITSLFFSVYSCAINTLFLCFLEDCERNDGSESRPYYMSKRLKKLLHR